MKTLVKKIDAAYFGGVFQRTWANLADLLLSPIPVTGAEPVRGCDRRIVIHYRKDTSSQLAALCDKYGSDKGEIKTSGHPYPWASTTYADYYSLLFGDRREKIRDVFECGIGTNDPDAPSTMGEQGRPGASLRVWREYFPNAQILGADIDRDILFEEDRIRTRYVDQTSPDSIRELWNSTNVESFDIMIDDGLHDYQAGICLFENSIQRLSQNGFYIIEDIMPKDLAMYQRYFADKGYRVEYINLFRSDAVVIDNNLVVIRK